MPNHIDVQKGLTDYANKDIYSLRHPGISDGDEELHYLSRHRKGADDSNWLCAVTEMCGA